MPAKKLVVSTYLQYILIAVGVFLLVIFVRQLSGVLMGGTVGVHALWVLFATLAAPALYGLIGAVFAVPSVAIVAATLRYLRSTLVFERWSEALVKPKTEGEVTPTAAQTIPSPAVTSALGPPHALNRGLEARDPGKE